MSFGIAAAISGFIGLSSALTLALSVASALYRSKQAKDAQKDAEEAAAAAADAAKGFRVTQEGEATSLPVVYGRAAIGGTRVYANVKSSFINGSTVGRKVFNQSLGGSESGDKNQFLFTQQALCMGGINAVYAADVQEVDSQNGRYSFGQKIIIDYNGGVADPTMSANFGARANSRFTNAAFATCVFKLDRDEYQYQGIPDVIFYMEGMKVYNINKSGNTYSLSGSKSYSNNPARCLLDYMTSTKYGKGLDISEFDLKSFYLAKLICEEVTMAAPLNGVLWNRKGAPRDIKLYEINTPLDTKAFVRDNIDVILGAMGDADLIWSAGKFRLNLSYPHAYDYNTKSKIDTNYVLQEGTGTDTHLYRALVDAPETTPQVNSDWERVDIDISDDDMFIDEAFTSVWPSAQDRLNHVKVTFLNESENFKEDSIEWPLKTSGVYATYLTEDSGLILESSFNLGYVTDTYHAQAEAEERVRSSRVRVTSTLSLTLDHWKLEPGDFLHVNSSVMSIPGELYQIDVIEVQKEGFLKVEVVKYDARNLAWNAKDDEVIEQRNVYDFDIEQATNLQFDLEGATAVDSVGRLSWTAADDVTVTKYEIKYTTTPLELIGDSTIWTGVATTGNTYHDIVDLPAGSYTFTVVSSTRTGRLAPQFNTVIPSKWPTIHVGGGVLVSNGSRLFFATVYRNSISAPATPTGGTFDFDLFTFTATPTDWFNVPPLSAVDLYKSDAIVREDGSPIFWSPPILIENAGTYTTLSRPLVGVTQDASGNNVGYGDANSLFGAILAYTDVTSDAGTSYAIDSTYNTTANISNTGGDKGTIYVTDLVGDLGTVAASVTYGGNTFYKTLSVAAFVDGIQIDPTLPPAPTGIVYTEGFGVTFIDLSTLPNYTVGHGHDHTSVYTNSIDDFGTAELVGDFEGLSANVPHEVNANLYYWLTHTTNDGYEGTESVSALVGSSALLFSYFTGAPSTNDTWNDQDAVATILSDIGRAPREGDVVTLQDSDWAESKKYENGAWVTVSNLINGNLVVTDSITADSMAANSITAGNAAIADLAVTNAKIADLSAGKITTGELAASQEIRAGNNLRISADGWIESYEISSTAEDPTVQRTSGDYVRLDSGNVFVYKYIPDLGTTVEYAVIDRVETGTAADGDTVLIPGYWLNLPNLIVSLKVVTTYVPGHEGREQRIEARYENLVETAVNSLRYTFDVYMKLLLAAGEILRNETITSRGMSITTTYTNIYSPGYKFPDNESTFTDPYGIHPISTGVRMHFTNVYSFRRTGVVGYYYNRKVRFRLEVREDNATSWNPVGLNYEYDLPSNTTHSESYDILMPYEPAGVILDTFNQIRVQAFFTDRAGVFEEPWIPTITDVIPIDAPDSMLSSLGSPAVRCDDDAYQISTLEDYTVPEGMFIHKVVYTYKLAWYASFTPASPAEVTCGNALATVIALGFGLKGLDTSAYPPSSYDFNMIESSPSGFPFEEYTNDPANIPWPIDSANAIYDSVEHVDETGNFKTDFFTLNYYQNTFIYGATVDWFVKDMKASIHIGPSPPAVYEGDSEFSINNFEEIFEENEMSTNGEVAWIATGR
ncbi:MAG: hypothetical protein DRQ62_00055 [Gammaproteobacteria bacterium]|nr:MAG: hypothetical protein DRQ62_00055 [Gammaproteobacteria bacterium]